MKDTKDLNNKSREDYLEAVLVIRKRKGLVRSVDVARQMQVSKASVSIAVSTLSRCGYLVKEKDFSLHLTEAGETLAERIYERHCFFGELLMKSGVDPEIAEIEACRMEHAISEDSFQKLKQNMRLNMDSDEIFKYDKLPNQPSRQ